MAEMMIASYGLPVDFVATINYGWKMGKELCETTGFILTTSGRFFKTNFARKWQKRLAKIA